MNNNSKYKKKSNSNIPKITVSQTDVTNANVNDGIQTILSCLPKLLLDAQKTKNNLERQLESDTEQERKYTYLETFEHKHGDQWTNVCDAIEGAQEMGVDKDIYEKLRHYHYRINNLLLESKLLAQGIENEKIKKELDREKEEIDKAHKQSESILNKLESVGSTVISMILSLGIVTALIYAIDRIDIRYVPLFVVCTLWLGLTMIIFNSRWFQYEDKTVENNKWLYVIISIFTFFIIIYTIFLLPDQVTNTCLPSSTSSAETVQD